MGTQTANRARVLVALRRWRPNASLRRLGDLMNSAKSMTINGDHAVTAPLPLAIVIYGSLRVKVEDGPWQWVGPGEIFGSSQYETRPIETPVTIVSVSKTAQYLALPYTAIESSARVPGHPEGVQ
jgi:hypothetical protein